MNPSALITHFARFLGGADEQAKLAAALAVQATQAGHVCADLDCDAGWGPWAAEMDDAPRQDFRARLPELVIVGGADDWTPLVWDGRRLYLRRYWDYEQRVATDLSGRLATPGELDPSVAALLQVRFADAGQRTAAGIALTRRLALISGGPGTGKTHTLARIIGMLQEENPSLRIALAAPTGKAAARMTEALQAAGVTVDGGAQTLHRLLGVRADGRGFRHQRERPLAVEVLVVDEASMIDLSLMAHLLDALPASARLILLGDRDQLAAVEAGAVFADLCDSPRLAAAVVLLTTSFRFGAESGIGRLAEATASGAMRRRRSSILKGWRERCCAAPACGYAAHWGTLVRDRYQPYLDSVAAGQSFAELFEALGRFRVLCAHRQDVATINRMMSGESLWPAAGTPLLILRNDPLLRVFNGDIGLVLPDPADGQLKCCFPGDTGNTGNAWRWVPLQRLPDWEPAWAMTVHKSQGSEFAEVLLVLPAADSPVGDA